MADSALHHKDIVVVKVGTSSVMRQSNGAGRESLSDQARLHLRNTESEIAISAMGLLVDTVIEIRRANYDVIIVSSGALQLGCTEMQVSRRPAILNGATHHDRARVTASVRAFSAIGQSLLMQTYRSLFSMVGVHTAQVLLSIRDLESEDQFESFKSTIVTLISLGVVPIINENDTTSTEQLKYGDNDWISAIMAAATGASWLFLLTDVDRLYGGMTRTDANAIPISVAENIEMIQVAIEESNNGTGTEWGTGIKTTEIHAARLATAAGVRVCLVHRQHPLRVLNFVQDRGVKTGTVFEPLSTTPLAQDRKKWIAICLYPLGELVISEAASVLLRAGHPLNVNEVFVCNGVFVANSAVKIRTVSGLEVGRGICDYSSIEITHFVNANHILNQDGMAHMHVVVHEDNVGLLVDTNIESSDHTGRSETAEIAESDNVDY